MKIHTVYVLENTDLLIRIYGLRV